MRAFLLCAMTLSSCRTSATPATSVLQPALAWKAVPAGCHGTANEVEVRAPDRQDAPLVVLQENHLHGGQSSQPTITIWASGRILFSRQDGAHSEELETWISAAAARSIAHEVFAELDGVARYTNADKNYLISGGQLTTIVVRDGSRWRTASVYDVYRDGFLGTEPKPDPPEQPGPPPVLSNGTTVSVPAPPRSGFDLGDFRSPPPPRFAAAYRKLFESLPREGTPFSPYQYDAVFFAPDRATRLLPDAVAWPRDLPAPPADLRPSACDPYETDGCRYAIGPEFLDATERLRAAIRPTDHKYRAVVANGSRFVVRFDALYEGERDIEAVARCARSLWHEKGP